jgi:hypothetical protein
VCSGVLRSRCLSIQFLSHDWIRTSDLFRVKAFISSKINNLQAAGDCQNTRKYVEDGNLAGGFTGEKLNNQAR